MKHVMTIMRANPPTLGHSLLFEQLNKYTQQGYAAILFLTHTQIKPVDYRRVYKLTQNLSDPSEISQISAEELRNPLSWEQKKHFVNQIIEAHGFDVEICENPDIITLNDKLLFNLVEEGTREVVILVGSDRVPDVEHFAAEFNRTQPTPDTQIHIEVKSAGDRDADSQSVEGVSATKMRYFAALDDFESFQKGIDGDKDFAWDIFQAVKFAMEIPEEAKQAKKKSVQENALSDYLIKDLYDQL